MWNDSIIFRPWLLLWIIMLTSVSLFIAESENIFHYSSCGFWNFSKSLCFIKMLFNIRNVEVFVLINIDKFFYFFSVNLLIFFSSLRSPLLILFLGYFLHINFLSTYWPNILTWILYFDSTDELDHFRYLLFIKASTRVSFNISASLIINSR